MVVLVVALLLMSSVPAFAQDMDPTGSTPDNPAMVCNDWVEIAPGQTHWYKFHYAAAKDEDLDEDGQRDSQGKMEIKFWSTPAGAAELTLRNGEQARKWMTEGKNEWFGAAKPTNLAFKHTCDTKNKSGSGDKYHNTCYNAEGERIWFTSDYAVWAAEMSATGDYYVAVQPRRGLAEPASYKMEVSGVGCSFAGGH
jgi:hypothetical protein